MLKRIRRRYIALKIDSKETFSSKEFTNAVWDAVLKLYGEYGASKSNLRLIDYDAERGLALIQTVHTAVEMVRAALASITKIRNNSAAIHVLTISGTIKALRKKIKW